MHNIYFLKRVTPDPMLAIPHCANIRKMRCIVQPCLEALPASAAGRAQPRGTGVKRTSAMLFLNKSFIFCLMFHSLLRSKSLVDSGDQVCGSVFLPWPLVLLKFIISVNAFMMWLKKFFEEVKNK